MVVCILYVVFSEGRFNLTPVSDLFGTLSANTLWFCSFVSCLCGAAAPDKRRAHGVST